MLHDQDVVWYKTCTPFLARWLSMAEVSLQLARTSSHVMVKRTVVKFPIS